MQQISLTSLLFKAIRINIDHRLICILNTTTDNVDGTVMSKYVFFKISGQLGIKNSGPLLSWAWDALHKKRVKKWEVGSLFDLKQ
jgi:hypothetical protein